MRSTKQLQQHLLQTSLQNVLSVYYSHLIKPTYHLYYLVIFLAIRHRSELWNSYHNRDSRVSIHLIWHLHSHTKTKSKFKLSKKARYCVSNIGKAGSRLAKSSRFRLVKMMNRGQIIWGQVEYWVKYRVNCRVDYRILGEFLSKKVEFLFESGDFF